VAGVLYAGTVSGPIGVPVAPAEGLCCGYEVERAVPLAQPSGCLVPGGSELPTSAHLKEEAKGRSLIPCMPLARVSELQTYLL